MNIFNRVVMVILLLLGVVTSIALIFTFLLFPEETLANLRGAVDLLEENLGLRILVASAVALIAIASFLLLLLEIVPRSPKGIQLTGVTGASAQLTLDAIVNRIRYEVEAVPSVRQVKPTVTPKGKAVDVNLEMYTDPTVDVATKTEEVSGIVRDAVENKLGVRLRNLKIYVRQDFYRKEAKGRGTPQQNASSETRPFEPK